MKEFPSGTLAQIKELHAVTYAPIGHLCQWLSANISLLEGNATPAEEDLYIHPVSALVNEVTLHLRFCTWTLVPYIDTMIRKGTEQHDCRQCTGSCNLDHTLTIEHILANHKKMRIAFLKLKPDEWPSYTDAGPDAAFLPLKELTTRLHAAVDALIAMEETQLIPKLIETQKAIYAQ